MRLVDGYGTEEGPGDGRLKNMGLGMSLGVKDTPGPLTADENVAGDEHSAGSGHVPISTVQSQTYAQFFFSFPVFFLSCRVRFDN